MCYVICSESSNGTFVLVKEIEGGEHAGFGYYDSCKGDSGGPAWVEILTEANYRSRLAHVTGKHQMFIYSRTWRPWLWRSELSAGDQTVQCRRKTLNKTTGVSVWYIFYVSQNKTLKRRKKARAAPLPANITIAPFFAI